MSAHAFWKAKLVTVLSKLLMFFDNKHYVVVSVAIVIFSLRSLSESGVGEKYLALEKYNGEIVEVSGVIVDEPKEDRADVQIVLDKILVDRERVGDLMLLIKAPRVPYKFYGDECEIVGRLEIPDVTDDSDFDYKKYLQRKGIYGVVEIDSITCIRPTNLPVVMLIRRSLVDLRFSLVDRIEMAIPEPQSSLLAGILFGEERVFEETFAESLRLSGTTHIVAASGYNVTLLANLTSRLLFFLHKRWKIAGSFIVVWLFALFSGFSPSILRAVVMISIVLVMKIIGVQQDKLFGIILSVMLFAVFSPGVLWSLSFQLSFTATIGLIYFTGLLDFSEGPKSTFYSEYIVTTIVATISTAPVLIYNFGEISLIGIFANLLILPILESTMLIGIIGVMVGYLSVGISDFAFSITYWQLKWFELVVDRLAQFSVGIISFKRPEFVSMLIFILLATFMLVNSQDGRELQDVNYYYRKAKKWVSG